MTQLLMSAKPQISAIKDLPKFLLIMRKGYRNHADHIQCLRNLGAELHLVTQVPHATLDPRFTSVTRLEEGETSEEQVQKVAELGLKKGVKAALTFQETDIEFTGLINQCLGVTSARPEADRIARDKGYQRRFLRDFGIPSVHFAEITTIEEGLARAEELGYPLVLKPTRAAASKNVTLVRSRAELAEDLQKIFELANSKEGNYYQGGEENLALLEDFLPGEEVALDGIVLGGQFFLAGIHNKLRRPGPFFEDDLYSLPFKMPEREPELARIAQAITTGLGLQHSLFNAELRQDKNGDFRVVEFSTRISGGHLYRQLREVYGFDLVRLYAKGFVENSVEAVFENEIPRLAPRMAACMKVVYRTGLIRRNSPGEAYHSPHYVTYYLDAMPGRQVACAPLGFDITGTLGVAAPYRETADIERVEQIAIELESKLDIVVEP